MKKNKYKLIILLMIVFLFTGCTEQLKGKDKKPVVNETTGQSLTKNIISKIAALPALPGIKRFSKTMDYKSYGGALFLGVKKPVVKAHGSSDETLFEFTIKQAEQFVNNKTVENLISEFEKQKTE